MPLLFHWNDHIDAANIASASYNLGMLSWGFTQLSLVTTDLSECAGYASRIGNFYTRLVEFAATDFFEPSDSRSYQVDGDSDVIVRNLTIFSPSGEKLVDTITLSVQTDTLIMGPTGTGKTTLVKILAGLHNHFMGEVIRPSSVLFVSQVTYLPLGVLEQQIVYPLLYPDESGHLSRDNLIHLFELVGLDRHVLQKFDSGTKRDWTTLSPGQQQQLVMARVLYHKPKVVVMDEITSSVDLETEAKFYRACNKLNIRVLSIGHRESLKTFHENIIKLDTSSPARI